MPDPMLLAKNQDTISDSSQNEIMQNNIVERAIKKRKKRRRGPVAKVAADCAARLVKIGALPGLVNSVQHNATYGQAALTGLPGSNSVPCRTDVGNGWSNKSEGTPSSAAPRTSTKYGALAKYAAVLDGLGAPAPSTDAPQGSPSMPAEPEASGMLQAIMQRLGKLPAAAAQGYQDMPMAAQIGLPAAGGLAAGGLGGYMMGRGKEEEEPQGQMFG